MKSFLLSALFAATVYGQPVPAPGNVALPLDEYNTLVDRAKTRPADPAPLRHLLKSADLRLSVNAESVSGTVSLQGELLSSGTRKIPLITGLIVTGSTDLPLQQEGGTHSALMTGPGPFSADLSVALPLTIETGRASFNLPAPSAGAVRLTLDVPGVQTLVNVSPGLITSRSSNNGRTTIESILQPDQVSNIWWAARLNSSAAPAAPREVRFLSDVKTIISVSRAEVTMAALAEINVVQGEPDQFRIQVPPGYELTGATGPTVAGSEIQGETLIVSVTDPALRAHQFLFSFTRPNLAARLETALPSFIGTQRETGELLVEGEGAMELAATELGGLRRMDLKETNASLRSLAGSTLHAAFRYQKRLAELPGVALEWVRFPESSVLSAVAQNATVTTLVTSEGRSLTEVKLVLKNKAQPFLKLELPAGATVLSADVAGEKVKPVQGSDGDRVPLLRAGFRPTDAYEVSFVFLHAGAPFAKKGDTELALPKMDIPIGHLGWEVFLPQRYRVANFAGDAVPARLLRLATGPEVREFVPPVYVSKNAAGPGQLGGVVVDPAGAVIPNVTIDVTNRTTGATYKAVSDQAGRWSLANVPSGALSVLVQSPGFKTYVREFNYNPGRGNVDIMLEVGMAADSVTVTAEASLLKTESASITHTFTMNGVAGGAVFSPTPKEPPVPIAPPSVNVANLQQRVAGVLPISINVPRTGNSYQFARVLVMDEETKLTFKYRRQ